MVIYMKKLSEYSKSERIITILSSIWLIIIFVVSVNESGGDFDEEFITIFFVFGILPVLVIIGWKWIKNASYK